MFYNLLRAEVHIYLDHWIFRSPSTPATQNPVFMVNVKIMETGTIVFVTQAGQEPIATDLSTSVTQTPAEVAHASLSLMAHELARKYLF